MDGKPRRPVSIDGISVNRNPHHNSAKRQVSTPVHRSHTTASKPNLPKSSANIQQPSPVLFNMARPNPRYTDEDLTNRKKSKLPKKDKWSRRKKIVTSALILLLIGFSLGGWYGSRIISNLDKVFHGNIFSDASALFSQATLNGEAQGRVNILVAGDSADDPGHAGADLTDSIMVLSINTRNDTGFMLSVPRDLWVNIPSLGSQKINAANEVTNFSQSGYPSGGMGQLQKIVQTDLGIPIDYYALVNYEGFKDSVNAVGGITVDIQSPDPRGIYDQFTGIKLPNGEDTINGQQALELARARGDIGDYNYGFPNTDFTRTQHQREMVVAIAKKASSLGVVSNPIRVSQLFDALGNNVKTNLSLQDALALASLTKKVNLNNLGSYTYSSTTTGATNALLSSYTDPTSGEEALVPTAGLGDYDQLQEYWQQLTSNNPVVKEGASITVLNASNAVGLAKQEEGVLQSKGIDNVSIADANNEHLGTMIVDNSKGADPNTKQLIEKLFPGTVVTSDTGSSEAVEAQGYTSNFVVILGENWDSTSQ